MMVILALTAGFTPAEKMAVCNSCAIMVEKRKMVETTNKSGEVKKEVKVVKKRKYREYVDKQWGDTKPFGPKPVISTTDSETEKIKKETEIANKMLMHLATVPYLTPKDIQQICQAIGECKVSGIEYEEKTVEYEQRIKAHEQLWGRRMRKERDQKKEITERTFIVEDQNGLEGFLVRSQKGKYYAAVIAGLDRNKVIVDVDDRYHTWTRTDREVDIHGGWKLTHTRMPMIAPITLNKGLIIFALHDNLFVDVGVSGVYCKVLKYENGTMDVQGYKREVGIKTGTVERKKQDWLTKYGYNWAKFRFNEDANDPPEEDEVEEEEEEEEEKDANALPEEEEEME
jgi:hypothetical protein